MEYSSKIAVRNLVEICVAKGVEQVVVSPGSRNAPFSITFNRHPKIKATVIVDERSAAFYALGLAQQSGKTVAIVCTSGTAALNYAPAIAEAYYQKIPLLVLTADRPNEWIDQMDGQTIRQENIFGNYIKKSFALPVEPSNEDEVWHTNRICSEAIESTYYPESGPVHINIPLREPLYDTKDYSNTILPKVFSTISTKLELPQADVKQLQKEWSKSDRILIVTGLLKPNTELNKVLEELAKMEQVVVLTETTSNLYGDAFNRSIDRLLVGIENKEAKDFQPDLLISLGGPIVSKKVKAFLRNHPPHTHWHINASNDYTDTFKSLSKIIPVAPEKVLSAFIGKTKQAEYGQRWKSLDVKLLAVFKEFIRQSSFSDLKVFDYIFKAIPSESQLQLANSTTVRYSNLFDQPANKSLQCFSNRGTSGIDGTISTAVGAAVNSDKTTTVITGDLSFFYDSNALWIKPMPNNLKIIIINNQGGNIFRIIDGPKSTNEVNEFFEAQHELNAGGIASTFNIPYESASTINELEAQLKWLYGQSSCAILEVFTDNEATPETLKAYFQALKNA